MLQSLCVRCFPLTPLPASERFIVSTRLVLNLPCDLSSPRQFTQSSGLSERRSTRSPNKNKGNKKKREREKETVTKTQRKWESVKERNVNEAKSRKKVGKRFHSEWWRFLFIQRRRWKKLPPNSWCLCPLYALAFSRAREALNFQGDLCPNPLQCFLFWLLPAEGDRSTSPEERGQSWNLYLSKEEKKEKN